MQSPIVLFPTGKDRPRLGVWLFIIAWLLGNVALIGLTNQGEEMVFTCAFAIACGLWWGGFKLGSLSTAVGTAVGFIVLVIWTLGLLSALALSFQSFASDIFFWVSSAMVLFLVVLAALSKTSPATSSKSD